MKILYFAWLRTRIGCGEEDVDLPEGVATVADLLTWLEGRGGGYAEALARTDLIRVAVNQEFAATDAPVGPDDEVALFPPVTGG
jgi:molybdopterin synthase sulfur carrier subunit